MQPLAISSETIIVFVGMQSLVGGLVAEWLSCWTQAQKGLGSDCSHDAVE